MNDDNDKMNDDLQTSTRISEELEVIENDVESQTRKCSNEINHVSMNDDDDNYDDPEPKTYKQVIRCQEQEEWSEAMTEEILASKKHKTWELVDLPVGRNLIGCKCKWRH